MTTAEVNFQVFQSNWTYQQDCGCRVTLAEDQHYLKVVPGKYCTLHTARHQEAAKAAFLACAKAALAEYRHVIETAGGRFLMVKQHGGRDLYAVVDNECMSGFMTLPLALSVAQALFGCVTLPVWDCDTMAWQSDMISEHS
jgi:hypothetical protein